MMKKNIYETLLDTALKLMRSDFASFQLYSPETETLSLIAHKNFDQRSAAFWHTVSAGSGSVCGEALQNESRILVNDIETEAFAKDELEIFRLSGIRAVQSTPIISRSGDLIGMLNTQWKQPRTFSEEDFHLFDVLVRQTADLIERNQAEQALRASEGRLRRVLDGMGEGFGVLAPDFTILEHNREALRLDGRAREQIVGRSHWEVFPGSENSELGRLLKKAMAERVPVSLEHLYAWEAGRALWLEMRAYPTADGMLAVFWRDVTSRREAQNVLHESEAKYRTLFDSIDEGFFLCDVMFDAHDQAVDIFYLEANPAATLIAGLDFTGRRLSEIAPDYELYWYEIFGRVAKTGVSERFVQYAEPHHKWLDCFVFKIGDEDSRRAAIIFQDITEQKLAHDALRESEARFRRLFTNNMVPMFLWTPAGETPDANDAFLDLIGYTREELEAGKCGWAALTPPELRARDLQALAEVEAKGFCEPYEKQFRHKDGHLIPILIGAGVFDYNKNLGVSYAIDLTDPNASRK